MKKATKQGSLWRRWDLHLHTPDTKLANAFKSKSGGDVWEEYLDALEASDVSVFGVTDYFCCKSYFTTIEKYAARFPHGKGKIFFPNIEFRLSEAIGANGKSPDLHVIFDNDPAVCSRENIEKFLNILETHETRNGKAICCSDLKTEKDFNSATVSLKSVKESLEKVFGHSEPFILVFPAKNDGMKSTDTKVPRKISIATEIDRSCHAFFGGADSTAFFLTEDRHGPEQPSERKPVYSGSDAHSLQDLERLSGLVTGFAPTWIKAEPTFRGLQQTIFEPSSRVHIGEQPEVQRRLVQEATKFISSLKIDQVSGYDGKKGHWFKNVEIPINPELTAIIGNKGSGKSAIADIIGLLGDSKQDGHFSFLTDKTNNRKFRQKGYADNFEAELTWVSGQSSKKNLADQTDKTKAEQVKYLPQNFFETLTNEIEVKQFQQEIEEVVFSHVEETDRLKTKSFKELEELKTKESRDKISSLKVKLREVNYTIDSLIRQNRPEFKLSLEKALLAKQSELTALQAAMPLEVLEPAEESPEQREVSAEIEVVSALLVTLEVNERACLDAIATKKARLEKARTLNTAMIALNDHIKTQVLNYDAIARDLGLSIEQIVQYSIKREMISALEVTLRSEIEGLSVASGTALEGVDLKTLTNLLDIRKAKETPTARLLELREKLSAPHKRYQIYLQDKLQIQQKMALIQGDATAPQADTIAFIQSELRRIDTDLVPSIAAAKAVRKTISKEIYDSKMLVLEFYKELKASVEERLLDINGDEFKVSIEASFAEAPNFVANFFDIVSQGKRGPFYTEGEAALRTRLTAIDWSNFDSIHGFAESIITDMDQSDTEQQVRKSKTAKELYDFLFELDYIKTNYELRLGNDSVAQIG